MTRTLALIGVGQIAPAHVDGVRNYNKQYDDGIRVTAVVDSFPGRAETFIAEQFKEETDKPAILEGYEALLEGPDRPDMVSILLPHHLHLEVGRKFLEAGIAVQMQKPIGLAIRDSRELIDIARKTGTPFVVSEPSVLGRGTRLGIEWVRSGKQLGEPTFLIDQAVIDLQGGFFMTPWRHLKGMAGAGWFIDHGVHRTHWMLDALGPCEKVWAQTRLIEPVRENDRWGKVEVDTEDLAAATMRFQSGVIAQWSVMSGGRGKGHGIVQMWGTNGSFLHGRFTASGEKEDADPDYSGLEVPEEIPDHPFAHSYWELIQLMEGRKVLLHGDPERALEAEAMVYACLESSHTGEVVKVADVVAGRREEYEKTVWSARDQALAMNMNKLT